MGMPVTLEIVDGSASQSHFDRVFDYFSQVDQKYSPYKEESYIGLINSGRLKPQDYSGEMREILSLCEATRQETNGYFNIFHHGKCDPSGLVKGWAIYKAAQIVKGEGFKNFYVDAGGDIEVSGLNGQKKPWSLGIKNPFDENEVVKIVYLKNGGGLATSGTYIRGQHIYNPHNPSEKIEDVVSLTVVGPNIYEADRFATAAFAMGRRGIEFIEKRPGLEGYLIDLEGRATLTSGFELYCQNYD